MIFDAILNINRASLKRKNKLSLVLFFYFSCFLYATDIQRVQIPSKDLAISLVYENSVLATAPYELTKMSLSAHVDWTVTSNNTLDIVGCRFNTILILDGAATLKAYDIFQGLSLWKVKGRNIESISMSFPYIVYKTHSGRLGAIDFLTGQPLWETETIGLTSFLLVGRSSDVVIMTKTGSQLLDITNGSISDEILPILPDDYFLFSWNKGALIQRDDDFFVYTKGSDELVVVSANIGQTVEQIEQYHIIGQSELKKNELVMVNVLTSEEKRVFHTDKPMISFALSQDSVYGITEDNELIQFDVYTGEHTSVTISLPALNLSKGFNVYNNRGKTVLYTPFDLINLTL